MHGNERAGEALSWLDAVWPCELSCFVVVDPDDYARAHGITHPDERTGLKEHIHEVRGAHRAVGGTLGVHTSASRSPLPAAARAMT
ncbi:hypothetical protein [Streptomyces clavifer]|uniref:hypothetical protein n=1 Tax=Streptomyces clavifer TaxID=68188 RepID=UPI0036AFF4DD